ncbi:hypothetical protein HA72_1669 [Metallosphaera sedula]|uniref:Uncharacterized protein n=4 Tax=Sulfolobaceae TaxID=118883 RepID=A4YHC2_METS5|nr:hypothetical protein Msed_1669 [Metallosphaera sedula DSM 5348]AIM27808.1 hypothetical protein HA72_1669 [Metallosphaera sedula]QCO30758.1 hypothetical protein DFR88_09900 [Metallosphaera prunae]AKV74658.1 hypothetical protein MsedA_1703 [Metallosphaera sedula]AKV76895.1 hypothetical protein MsedB_1705 [Metallosphaera sedula]
MTLQTLVNVTNQLFHPLSFNTEPLSITLIAMGLIVLFLVAIGGMVYGLFKAVKAVPNLTTKQFILFLLLLAAGLVVIGILLP